MNGEMEQMGQVSTSPLQPMVGAAPPKPPTVAMRITDLENRVNAQQDISVRQERQINALMAQNLELREEMGMPPLPPDFFA